jgi:polar amino acid transport system substrate-binding protein
MKLKKVLGGLVVAASVFLLAACGSSSSEDTSLKDIQDKGTLVVALNPEFAPFEFKTLVDGKDTIVGADVDLAQAIADELGVDLKISSMSFNNVLTSVQSGKADIAISGISSTAERAKVYDFSEPYYESANVVIIRKTDASKYTKTDSFDGLSVGAQKGSIQEAVVTDQLSGAKLVAIVQNSELINELKNSQLEGVVFEKAIAQGYVANNDDLMIADVPLETGDSDAYAIAMPKGSAALKAKIDKVVTKLKDSGEIEKFVEEAYKLSITE